MLVISVSVRDGVKTSTLVEGDWEFKRVGWANPWTATHEPTGIVLKTGKADLTEAKQAARSLAPHMFPTETVEPGVRYTVEPRFDRRFTGHRQGEPR